MASISRDISITLTVKILLLVALWSINFTHAQKPLVNVKQWMLPMTETPPSP